MAETKTPPEETKDDFNYSEIHNPSTQEVAAEVVETPVKETEEVKPEVKEVKEEVEETKEVKEEPKPEINVEEITAKATEQATKDIVSKLVGETPPAETDKVSLAVQDFEKKNARMPDWSELASIIKDTTKQDVLDDLKAENEAKEKAAEEEKVAYEKREKEYNTYWDEQIADLTTRGELPVASDATDPKDPANQARAFIFNKMVEVRDKNIAEGKPYSLNAKEIWYDYKGEFKAQPAGANAPVNGAGKSVNNQSGSDFDYSEIHGKDMRSIIAGE